MENHVQSISLHFVLLAITFPVLAPFFTIRETYGFEEEKKHTWIAES